MAERPHPLLAALAGGERSLPAPAVLGIVVLAFAAILGLMLASGDPADAPGNLSVVPIAVLALAFGRRGGLAGAAAAFALLSASDLLGAQAGLSPLGYLTRGIAYLLVGAVVGVVCDRLRVRAELTAALVRAQDELGDGCVVADPRSERVVWMSPAARALWGGGDTIAALEGRVDARDLPRLAEQRRLRRAGHPVPARYEFRLRGGRERCLEATTGEVDLGGDRLSLTLLRDVSERRAAERREAQARSALDLRSVEVARTNADLAHFASVAAHDLSEPVRAVTGFAELLRRRAGAALEPRARDHLAAIEAAGERMVAMLDGLRAYGAVHRDDERHAAVDLEAVLDRVVEATREELAARGGRLERGPLPTVLGHAGQLEQVLGNLVGNALKYGNGAPPHVRVNASRESAAWRVTVADNGVGIPERHHARIFEMFRRLHGEHEVSGTGVGLAICQRIVWRHGGDIRVDAGPDGGSVFSFTLPDPEVRP